MTKELIYFIGGIFMLYGISISIMCYRAIKSSSEKAEKMSDDFAQWLIHGKIGTTPESYRKAKDEDERQQERLLAEAYRILNNAHHELD